MTTTEQIPTVQQAEQKEQSNGKFNISLLRIENKEDKFSYITNLSILSNITKSVLKTKLQLKGDDEDFQITEETNGKNYPNLIQQIERIKPWVDRRSRKDFGNSWLILFTAKDIQVENQRIIITDTSDISYLTTIENYLSTGLQTLKKVNEWEINATLAQEKQNATYYLQWPLLNIRTQKKLLNIGADDYCITDERKEQFCVLKDNTIGLYEYDDDSTYQVSDTYDLSNYGTIKNIKTDINNNFYFIIAEKEERSELKVLNRKTKKEIMSFPDMTEITYLSNEQWILFCMDKDGYLRIITINTKKLPRGYVDTNEITAESVKKTIIKVEDTSRHELQKALNEGGIELKLTDEEFKENNEDQTDYESLRKALWNTKIQTEDTQAEEMETVSPSEGDEAKPGGGLKKSITLKQLFTSAKTLPEINKVYALAQQLKTNPKVIAVKGLIDPILQQISEKREKIRLETISQSLQEIVAELPTLSDFSDMIIIKNKLTHIKKERSQIIVVDKDFDALIKETLTTVEEKITEYQSSHQAEIHKNIEVNIELIEEYMKNIDYLVQITSVYNTELRKQTKELLTYLPEEDKKTLDDKLVNLVKQRQTELKSLAQQEVKGQQEKQQKTIEKILNQINDIKDIVLSITEEDTLDQMEKSDPLVREVKQGIEELPAQKAQELSIKLDQIFKERSLSIKFSKEETKGSFKNLDQYGIPKSLYFVPEIQKKVKWEIYGKPTKDNKYKLQFRSSAGNIIEPDINKKILGNYEFEYTQEEWIALKKKINERNSNEIKKKYYDLLKNITSWLPWQIDSPYQGRGSKAKEGVADYYIPRMLETMNRITWEGKLRNISQRNNLPHIDNKTVITPTIQKTLARRGQILSQQLLYKQGYMIVESEAGTGKNFKCDILGHLTNREVFDISCNEHMEKEDLLFSPEINNDGTFRRPSKLVQGLQTPGAIIVLDEVNTLKPGVSKLLNPLLDGRRYINDAQLGKVHAHPTVLIVGLMNPRYYRGTRELPQEQISRAIITSDEYSQSSEEAFLISKYLDGALANLTSEEFENYRNQYVIKGDTPNNKTVSNTFLDLDKVVKVAKKVREEYSKTMKGDAEIWKELQLTFTTREGIQIVQDFNFTKNIKQSIENILLPKISDFDQKAYAKSIIEQIIPTKK